MPDFNGENGGTKKDMNGQDGDNILHRIEPRVKLWLEVDGEVVFGSGRVALFEAIEETGSIKQASEKISMSYRAAWGKIKATEDRLGSKLVQRQAGGRNSGAELTPKGKELLMIYRKYKQDVATAIDNAFCDFFQDFER
jgi:molybdate transport system regulatory protein